MGISFLTFQQIAYVVDSYRGETTDYSFLDYAVFVAFFPRLIAGPIVLHDEFMPQLNEKKNHSINYENFSYGILMFAMGLAKKIFIADVFAQAVNWGYGSVGSLTSLDAFIVMLSYTFQIYFDFSSYTDMAIGIGLMFNIKLPITLTHPIRLCRSRISEKMAYYLNQIPDQVYIYPAGRQPQRTSPDLRQYYDRVPDQRFLAWS